MTMPELEQLSFECTGLTLTSGEDVLLLSDEASNGPNAHPQINCKVTKFPSATHLGPHRNWKHPSK